MAEGHASTEYAKEGVTFLLQGYIFPTLKIGKGKKQFFPGTSNENCAETNCLLIRD